MTLAPQDRVYVAAPFRRGTGTVISVRRDGTARVALDCGGTVKVAECHVRPLEREAPPAQQMTRAPDYAGPGDPWSSAWVDKDKAVRSPAYLEWIRRQPCAWCSKGQPSEASHHPEEGHGSTGRKASDLDTLPLCRECHHEWHQHTRLGQMTSADTKTWCQVQIKRRNQRYMLEVLKMGSAA